MNINRYDVLAEGYAGEFWTVEVLKEDGEYVRFDGIKDNLEIIDQQLAEIASLKAELFTLMSSLESWDEEFK